MLSGVVRGGDALSGADGIALGTGNQNTIDIMTGCSFPGIAARLAGDLILNGYSDWYLPSKDELNKVYINRGVLGLGGSPYPKYWASTEDNNNGAYGQDFYNGNQASWFKDNYREVKAIRIFPATQASEPTIVLAGGSISPVTVATNVVAPSAGGTAIGAVRSWVTGTADKVKFTVTDVSPAVSTITINGNAYTSDSDYTVVDKSPFTIVVTTTEVDKTTVVRTFIINVTAPGEAIGDNYLGGKIAYFLKSGDPGYTAGQTKGLIVALSDQSTSIQWYNGSNIATGTATALGTGTENTDTIIGIQGAGSYAAILARNYNGGGFTDWYLPSKDELHKLFVARAAIGGLDNGYWWSSSEDGTSNAWEESLSMLGGNSWYKNIPAHVRAIRSFPAPAPQASKPSVSLAGGSTSPVGIDTNVVAPSPGRIAVGAVKSWVTGTADKVKFTVTDTGNAVSTITINGNAYTSGSDYTIAVKSPFTIVVTTTETSKETGVRTFTINVQAPGESIGDSYQGGMIAYILQSGDTGYVAGQVHGLISSLSNQSEGATWGVAPGCYGVNIPGAEGTAIGTGYQNTMDMIAVSNCINAAQLVYGVTINGYSDWYIPSKDELNKLFEKMSEIGGFTAGFYWSSSEVSTSVNRVWGQTFDVAGNPDLNIPGAQSEYFQKNDGTMKLRAVRSF